LAGLHSPRLNFLDLKPIDALVASIYDEYGKLLQRFGLKSASTFYAAAARQGALARPPSSASLL